MSKESISSSPRAAGATTFAGKRALITGASSGLGLEFADLLAAQKVNLVLAARRQEPMEKLASAGNTGWMCWSRRSILPRPARPAD
jgi:NAD(P)-dependent dehydrogenase (short-subunit alcohol dehydrogenase family)